MSFDKSPEELKLCSLVKPKLMCTEFTKKLKAFLLFEKPEPDWVQLLKRVAFEFHNFDSAVALRSCHPKQLTLAIQIGHYTK